MVTFASFTDEPVLDRPGFAEDFLRARGIDAIHVISRDNAWYQYPEVPGAMARVREAAAAYGRVVTYGSSMGAYAALRLAGLVGAQGVIALSPQFSSTHAATPFEHRWDELRRIRPRWEQGIPLPHVADAIILFDPGTLDGRHAALFADACPVTLVPLPGTGHPVGGVLSELGLLQRLVLDACDGPVDTHALRRAAWTRRHESGHYLGRLAARSLDLDRRIGLLRRAAAAAPDHAYIHAWLGRALGQAGRMAEALAAHQTAERLHPGHPPLRAAYAATLRALGRGEDAAAIEAAPEHQHGRPCPDRATLHHPKAACDPGLSPPAGTPPIRTARGERGVALFGPYQDLAAGRYTVGFGVATQDPRRRPLRDWRYACTLQVTAQAGRIVVATRRLSSAMLRGADEPFVLPFTLTDLMECEFRVMVTGVEPLVVSPHRRLRRVGTAA